MFRAIGRWFKALGYLITGQVDAARRTLDTNPHVIRAKYDDVIRDKTARIQQYKEAVAKLIAQEERKLGKVRTLTEEIGRLERLKAGALAKAKQTVADAKAAGRDPESIKGDEDYQKCLAAYNDFSSSLQEKQARVAELEGDIADYRKTISDHKVQLQSLLRELETVKSESAEAVADVITANQEKEIADALAGIADDGTDQELQRLRELRQEVKAEARISRELAGTASQAQEAEFLAFARQTESASEFDALIGLSEEVDKAPASPEKTAQADLPE